MSLDWDVESYRSEHENEDHWELRKKFMLAHKDKFPEDELVCLAQVFTNIEFMGCRYPEKTMIRVAELAKGVVEKYREERKNSLKRTFVAASDAASAKVKGPKSESKGPKKVKINFISAKNNNATNSHQTDDIVIYSEGKLRGLLGEFVLIYREADDNRPVNIISSSVSANRCVLRWDVEVIEKTSKICKLFINNILIAEGLGANLKLGKEESARIAVEKLKKSHYSIKLKDKSRSSFDITGKSHLKLQEDHGAFESLGEDNIGMKLMKLMGWQGKGLGSQEQGMQEPLKVSRQNLQRTGFGHKDVVSKNFTCNAKRYIKEWMKDNFDRDLVFSSEFTIDERKELHRIASQLQLKSKSHGKDQNRQLVISKKIQPWEIIEELKKMGGNSTKYELIYPTKTPGSSDPDIILLE